MEAFEWLDFLSVGDAVVDKDHRHLLTILNRLSSANERRKREVVHAVVLETVDYACEHFAREEKEMAALGYPLLAEHVAAHRALTAQVVDWRNRVHDHWQPWHGSSFFAMLGHWQVSHILKDDHRVADFVRNGRARASSKAAPPALVAFSKAMRPTIAAASLDSRSSHFRDGNRCSLGVPKAP